MKAMEKDPHLEWGEFHPVLTRGVMGCYRTGCSHTSNTWTLTHEAGEDVGISSD